MKRYDIRICDSDTCDAKMEQSISGDYVEYEDYQELEKRARLTLEKIKKALSDLE